MSDDYGALNPDELVGYIDSPSEDGNVVPHEQPGEPRARVWGLVRGALHANPNIHLDWEDICDAADQITDAVWPLVADQTAKIETDWLSVGLGHYFAPGKDGSVVVGRTREIRWPPGVTGPPWEEIEAVRVIDRETWLRVLDHVGR